MNGSDFGDANADVIVAEQGAFVARDGFVGDFDGGREKEVSLGPAAGFENLGWHIANRQRKSHITSPNRTTIKDGPPLLQCRKSPITGGAGKQF